MKKAMTTVEFFNNICGKIMEKGSMPGFVNCIEPTNSVTDILSVEFEIMGSLYYGECGNVCLSLYVKESWDNANTILPLGTLKSNISGTEAMKSMANLLATFTIMSKCYVVENYSILNRVGYSIEYVTPNGEEFEVQSVFNNLKEARAYKNVLFNTGVEEVRIRNNKTSKVIGFGNLAAIRLRETRMMKNGQEASIVGYRSSTDIDIRFDDGTLVEGVKYEHYVNGTIKNPNKGKHFGERRMMRNGVMATIVGYRNTNDIDVVLDTKERYTSVSYTMFKLGTLCDKLIKRRVGAEIKHPRSIRSDRKGESKLMKNGQYAVIEEYRHCEDIDVRFEDHTLVRHATYGSFKRGCMKNPNFRKSKQ